MDQISTSEDINCSYFSLSRDTSVSIFLRMPFLRDFSFGKDVRSTLSKFILLRLILIEIDRGGGGTLTVVDVIVQAALW